MASISSLTSSSSSSSIYGTRNVISGLATGMDTESLIENAVSGYKTKITQLEQSKTKLEWEQDAYRSIISKLSSFTNNYLSYTSSTNLLSASFFTNATSVSSNGTFANLVSAKGKSSSAVSILGVSQLATAARYSVSGSKLFSSGNTVTAGEALDLTATAVSSNITGTLRLAYGGSNNQTALKLEFSESDVEALKAANGEGASKAEVLAELIRKKLGELADEGTTQAANVEVTVSGDQITMKDSKGNAFEITGASGDFANLLVKNDEDEITGLSTADVELTKQTVAYESVNGKTLSFTVDGTTKKITLNADADTTVDSLVADINSQLQSAFGGKVTASNVDGKLSFTVSGGSTLSVDGDALRAMGFSSAKQTSYMDTSKTLADLLGDNLSAYDEDGDGLYDFVINGKKVGSYAADTSLQTIIDDVNKSDAGVKINYSSLTDKFTFTATETGTAGTVGIESGSLAAALFGATEGADAGSKGSYTAGQDAIFDVCIDGETKQLTRSSNTVNLDGLEVTLKGTFGDYNVEYEDTIEINGKTYYKTEPREVTNYLGQTVTAMYVDDQGRYVSEKTGGLYSVRNSDGSFVGGVQEYYYGEPTKIHTLTDGNGNAIESGTEIGNASSVSSAVTFTTNADTDKIINAVKKMIEDYNALATEIKKAYSTIPEENSKGKAYEPLTDEDKADMSESAIKAYEEKAKAGLLFGDRDLSNLYSQLTKALNVPGLESIGITQTYVDGQTTLTLDENKFKEALEDDMDKVVEVFTGDGNSSKGLMEGMKTTMDTYGKTTGASKGILLKKAGSVLSPTTLYDNDLYKKMKEVEEEISKWEDKISDRIDYYTQKFTYLEQLVAQMNNQSSMLMGLSGGY